MPDRDHESSGFRVVDRRLFSEDGSVRSEAREEERESPATPPASGAGSSAGAPAAAEASDEISPEFEALVSYLSTTAMLQLGLLSEPSGESHPPDTENARRTIELLEVLQQKTRSNLTRGEASLLEGVLYELHLSTVEIEKRRPKKTP